MSNMEGEKFAFSPGVFSKEITYTNPSLKPSVVATGTSDIFSLYFDYKLPHFEVAKDYLQGYTLHFVDIARAGLASHPERVDRIGKATYEDLVRVTTIDRPSPLPKDETLEVLDYTLLTMGMMPEMMVGNYTDIEGNKVIVEFSKRGIFAPPRTLNETKDRIREIWLETLKIAQQITPPDIDFFKNPEVTRTIAFFDVAKMLPLKNPKLVQEESELNNLNKIAEKFNNPHNR